MVVLPDAMRNGERSWRVIAQELAIESINIRQRSAIFEVWQTIRADHPVDLVLAFPLNIWACCENIKE
jgi:hypothetical protein